MTAPLRVVIADDERPARSFLAALLRTFEDVTIVGEADSGRQAVSLIDSRKAGPGPARSAHAGARWSRRRSSVEET